jgi:hypothetical protein
MSIKTAITAMLLLSATALPALAENYANDPARPDSHFVAQRPLFGGAVAAQPGAAWSAVTGPTTRNEANNGAFAPMRTDATVGSSVPPFSSNPHIYDYLSGPEYRGGS